MIRVNTVHPIRVIPDGVGNQTMQEFLAQSPDLRAGFTNLMPVPVVEPEVITAAMAYLCSGEACYVTGVDAARRRRPLGQVAARRLRASAYYTEVEPADSTCQNLKDGDEALATQRLNVIDPNSDAVLRYVRAVRKEYC